MFVITMCQACALWWQAERERRESSDISISTIADGVEALRKALVANKSSDLSLRFCWFAFKDNIETE